MSSPNIFPIHYHCHDTYGWADCPALAKRIWLRIRQAVAPDLVWYGVAMKIVSAQQLTLYLYDMADTVTGGIGNQIFRCEVKRDIMTPDECAMMDAEIVKVCTKLAESELVRRENAERELRVIELRKELFGV